MKILTIALAAAALVPTLTQGAALDWRRVAGATWVCGGVGSDERRQIESLRQQARLEVRFVTETRGAYLAGVQWSLVGTSSSTPLVRVTAEGPVCLVDAPPGAYRVEAVHGDARRSTRVVIGKSGTARATLAFPGEPWDGISASPEEKAQAAAP